MTTVCRRFPVLNEHGVASDVVLDAIACNDAKSLISIERKDISFRSKMSAADARILIGRLHDALDFIEKWEAVLEESDEA